jgi:hypothetical protein
VQVAASEAVWAVCSAVLEDSVEDSEEELTVELTVVHQAASEEV